MAGATTQASGAARAATAAHKSRRLVNTLPDVSSFRITAESYEAMIFTIKTCQQMLSRLLLW